MTKPQAVWPQRCALSRLPGFNWLLQVLYGSLHVLDGGVTSDAAADLGGLPRA
jgi:hypothetical protein